MAETEVVVLCYWDCSIKYGPDGVYFEGSTPKEMRVKKKTDFSSFLDELYLITGFDKQKFKLEIVYRCPSPNRFRYQLYPVTCDGHLETMLELPSNSVELFLELKPIPGRVIDLRDPVENPRKKQKRTQQEVKGEDQASVVSGLWLEDNAMRVGLCFKDMEEMKKAVDWWSIKKQKKCYVRRETEDKDVYVFECVRLGCKWSICAARMEEKDGLFEITKCSGPHSCYPEPSDDFERRSLSAYVMFLGGSPISWKTRKQRIVSRSSAEAEYRSMRLALDEVLSLRQLLQELGFPFTEPVRMFCDSQAAIHIAANPVFHERTKHIEADCHAVRDAVLDGTISTIHIGTDDQLADLLTKPLGRPQFESLVSKLSIVNLHAPT